MTGRKAIRARFWLAALLALCGAWPALAQTAAISIPSQPLSSALRMVGEQSGQNILFTPSTVEGLTAPAVQGQMTAREAVDALLRGTGLVALADGAQGVLVQPAPPPPPPPAPPRRRDAIELPPEYVTVSSTRIARGDFNAPMPTTVLTAEDLQRSAQSSVFETLAQLPSVEGSSGPSLNTNATSTGLNGLSSFSLRGLGTIRTLILLDGQRVVPANVTGIDDISQLPQLLLKRVDVVTGGASASWGSDALAGVINFVTDKKFVGLKANILGGFSTYGDYPNVTLQAAGGTDFAGGRAHAQASIEYSYTGGLHARPGVNGFGIGPGKGLGGRDWNQAPNIQLRTIAATPAGQPQYTYGVQAQSYQWARYGLITGGPLRGTGFGAGGAPYSFQYGADCANSLCFGGDTGAAGNNGVSLSHTLTRGDVYARLSYDLDADTTVYATVNFSTVWSLNTPNTIIYKNGLTIQCANPFVPASVMAGCAANGINSFEFGTVNGEFPAYTTVRAGRDQRRYVLGGDGGFALLGGDWKWSGYLQHGTNYTDIHVRDISLNPRYLQAIDAVAGPGGPACRSAAAAATGCVPLNVLGDVPADPAAIRYIVPAAGPYQRTHQRQDIASILANGAPLENWAGAVAVAVGAEFREEAYSVKADPYGNGATAADPYNALYPADPTLDPSGNNWFAGNFHNGAGNYHVSEVFLETGIPLLNDEGWGRVDLNLGGRFAAYSGAGQAQTWKAGGTWDTPLDGLRLRALQSRDVRAPNLSEMFSADVTTNALVTNDFTGEIATVLNVTSGNSRLRPEKAQTTELGLVFAPSWLPDFSASLDYYRIALKDAIGSLGAQQLVDLCFYGNQAVCDQAIVTTTGGLPQTTPLAQVISRMVNFRSVVTDGFDLEIAYRRSLDDMGLPGDVKLRLLANHASKFVTDAGVMGQPAIQSAGTMTLGGGGLGNVPLWKLLAAQDYLTGPFRFSLTERWISDGKFNKMYVQCSAACPLPTLAHPTINFNDQRGAFYLDIGGSYAVSDRFSLYFKVDNLANLAPPPSPGVGYGVNPALYDVIGRMVRIGARLD